MADDAQLIQLTVYITQATKERLDALKEQQGIAITKFVDLAINERLEKVERALKPITKN